MKAFLRKIIPVKFRLKVFHIINSVFFAVCRLFPIKNRAFFYSVRADGRLLENSKIVYDYLGCDKFYIAKKLPHSQKIQPKICFALLTSRVIVIDDYCRYLRSVKLRKGQRVVQIWHAGGAFKSFGLDAPSKLTREQEKATHSQYSAVIVTGEECKKFFAGAFGVSEDICLPLGLPRTDILINQRSEMKNRFFEKHPEFKNRKIYLYCPTFREKDGERIVYDSRLDWERINGSLGENEIFILKKHPMMDYDMLGGRYEKIFDLSDESTLELICASDVLITDYSSVCHDAAILKIPAVFYCPDYKEYERFFYLKFPEDLPGEMITDGADLLNAVRRAEKCPPVEKMEKFRTGQVGACDGHSTERVAEFIMSLMK